MAACIIVAGVGACFMLKGPEGEDSEVEGIINPDDLTQITFFEGEGINTADPDWSPDGTQIVFGRHVGGDEQGLYIINSDGTNPRCMLRPEGGPSVEFLYGDIAWDNTGTKIVMVQWKSASEERPDIFVDKNVITFSWEEQNQKF